MKVFVISLEDAQTRRARVSKELENLEIPFIFFDAVNGFDGLPSDLQKKPDDTHRTIFRSRPLTPGEKGCYASHYLLWKKCVELNEPILILEDDFLPTKYFKDGMIVIDNIIHQYGYLKVEPQIGHATTKQVIDGNEIVFWHDNSRWTTGYAISPKTAHQFIETSSRWLCSVDNFIGESYRHKIPCTGIIPYMISRPDDMGSTIQNKVKLKKVPIHFKLTREMHRFYRFIRMTVWNKNNQ